MAKINYIHITIIIIIINWIDPLDFLRSSFTKNKDQISGNDADDDDGPI